MDQALSLRHMPKGDGVRLSDRADVPRRGHSLDRRDQQFRKLAGHIAGVLPDLRQLSGVSASGSAGEGLSMLGAFDDPSLIEIDGNVEHVFAERELSWVHVDDGFPRVEGQPKGLYKVK